MILELSENDLQRAHFLVNDGYNHAIIVLNVQQFLSSITFLFSYIFEVTTSLETHQIRDTVTSEPRHQHLAV